MKKTIFILVASTLLFSCEKEVVEQNGTTTTATVSGECECGVIDFIGYTMTNDTVYYESVIYNSCSMNDTTVNYIPQTNAGSDKSEGDPHCLGVSW